MGAKPIYKKYNIWLISDLTAGGGGPPASPPQTPPHTGRMRGSAPHTPLDAKNQPNQPNHPSTNQQTEWGFAPDRLPTKGLYRSKSSIQGGVANDDVVQVAVAADKKNIGIVRALLASAVVISIRKAFLGPSLFPLHGRMGNLKRVLIVFYYF